MQKEHVRQPVCNQVLLTPYLRNYLALTRHLNRNLKATRSHLMKQTQSLLCNALQSHIFKTIATKILLALISNKGWYLRLLCNIFELYYSELVIQLFVDAVVICKQWIRLTNMKKKHTLKIWDRNFRNVVFRDTFFLLRDLISELMFCLQLIAVISRHFLRYDKSTNSYQPSICYCNYTKPVARKWLCHMSGRQEMFSFIYHHISSTYFLKLTQWLTFADKSFVFLHIKKIYIQCLKQNTEQKYIYW